MAAVPPAERGHSAIRSRRERLIQTLWFEALGIVIVSPLFAHFAGPSLGKSIIVLTALSVTMMCWSALYNTAFDLVEIRCTRRVASDRPHGLRVLHTIGNEVTALIVTWPIMVALTPLAWLQALAAEIGLTLVYAVYGYLFHLGFDRLRPVEPIAGGCVMPGLEAVSPRGNAGHWKSVLRRLSRRCQLPARTRRLLSDSSEVCNGSISATQLSARRPAVPCPVPAVGRTLLRRAPC